MLTMTFIGANRDAWGYLLSTVSTEHAIDRATGKAAYYMAGGTPAGTWAGHGMRALGLDPDEQVEEAHLTALFGSGTHPVTGAQLGRKFQESLSIEHRVRARVATVLAETGLNGRDLQDVHDEIYENELTSPQTQSVAGFEFVFSPPKSVSSWWALADPMLKDEIRQAHHAAIQATIRKLETDIIRTRTGVDGIAQQHIQGVTAALFDHWDSRDGDPQLHTHMLVSNRVQGAEDGRWRTIDSRWSLSPAVSTAGTFYDTILMDELSNRFGVQWTTQDALDHPEKYQTWLATEQRYDSPASRHQFAIRQGTSPGSVRWQIDTVPAALNAEFSTRSRDITCEKDRLVAEHVKRHGTQPSARQVIKMRQQATLSTRSAKRVQSLKDLTRSWRDRATTHMGDSFLAADRISAAGRAQLSDYPLWSFRHDDVDQQAVTDAAAYALHALGTARSTWKRSNAETEVYRAIAGWRFRSIEDRELVARRITETVLEHAVALTPKNPHRTPHRFTTDRGEDMFHPESRDLYTTREVWEAEERLLQAGRDTSAATVSETIVTDLISVPSGTEQRILSHDQAAAVRKICESGRPVDVLVGPAGAGKTTTLQKLREIWETQHGTGSVRGLAPTARASEVLADSLEILTENTAKWLHETALGTTMKDGFNYQLRSEDLVIVDEASIAGTIALDRLRDQAAEAGAKLLLVGDWAQLAAIDAGGAFGLLATDRDDVPELQEIHRFTSDWEADASKLLRLGKTSGLQPYIDNDRVTWGLDETVVNAAVDAWKADEATFADDSDTTRTSLLIAPTNDMVTRLNHIARQWRVDQGVIDATIEAVISTGVASPGDRIVTRQNARTLRTDHDRWVKNNDEWVVVGVDDATGDMTVAAGLEQVTLPAAYCVEHVELAYATTAHRSQGRTVHTTHAIVDSSASRETFYVAMTRGKHSNRAYVVQDEETQLGDAASIGMSRTWRETLEHIVLTRGGDISAHETAHDEAERIGSIRQLAAEYHTLIADHLEREYLPLLGDLGLVDRDNPESPYLGPVLANLKRLEHAGADVPTVVAEALSARELGSARNELAVLHYRVDKQLAQQAATSEGLVAGLIEPAPRISDQDVRDALRDREIAIQLRAEFLVDRAIAENEPWISELGSPLPGEEEAWRQRAVTVACYRDLYSVDGVDALGREHEQARNRQRDRAIAHTALSREPRPEPFEISSAHTSPAQNPQGMTRMLQ